MDTHDRTEEGEHSADEVEHTVEVNDEHAEDARLGLGKIGAKERDGAQGSRTQSGENLQQAHDLEGFAVGGHG